MLGGLKQSSFQRNWGLGVQDPGSGISGSLEAPVHAWKMSSLCCVLIWYFLLSSASLVFFCFQILSSRAH